MLRPQHLNTLFMPVLQTRLGLLPLFSISKCLLYHTVPLLPLTPPSVFPFKQWIISPTGTSCFSNYINICPRVYWFADHSNQVKGNKAIPLHNGCFPPRSALIENRCHSSTISAVVYNVHPKHYIRGGGAWVMVSGTLAALSRRWEISSSDPANVPLSKPGKSNGLRDRSVTSAAVTLRSLVTALCEKKAPLCGWARQSVVRVCLGSWRGEAKSWQHSYGSSPNRPTMSNGKNKTVLYHTLGNAVGCSVTTGHSTLLPSWNLCQRWSGSRCYPGMETRWSRSICRRSTLTLIGFTPRWVELRRVHK